MRYKLLREKPNENYNGIETILYNRGIKKEDFAHYLNLSINDLNPPEFLGVGNMYEAVCIMEDAVSENKTVLIVVDCDCDGYTSAAIFANYFYYIAPDWQKENFKFFLHEGKEHGLKDCLQNIIERNPDIVVIPDAGSNDVEECKILSELGMKVIILDHHEMDVENPHAIVINSQQKDYPNHELSGAGVVYQFCRFCDNFWRQDYAKYLLDLTAVGLIGDMMSLKSYETRYIIEQGIKDFRNPLITSMIEKNSYSLGNKITPWGITFYIVPYINAVVRSGTKEEKVLVFSAMLISDAYTMVDSTKRGHKLGDQESIVEQATRILTNVKNRQTKAQDAGMEKLEHYVSEHNDDKVILIPLDDNIKIESTLRGLIANKLMGKYNKPCLILSPKAIDDGQIVYEGSARGCDKTGVTDFKDICESTGLTNYCTGHQGAFGCSVNKENLNDFKTHLNTILEDVNDDPVYLVDYIFKGKDVIDPNIIFDVAECDCLWGKDMPESLVVIEDLMVTPDMVTVYTKKNNTLKITLPNKINIMMFNASNELCELLQKSEGKYHMLTFIGTCHINEWMGNRSAQIFVEDWHLGSRWYF